MIESFQSVKKISAYQAIKVINSLLVHKHLLLGREILISVFFTTIYTFIHYNSISSTLFLINVLSGISRCNPIC